MTQTVAPFSISRIFNAPRDLVFKMHTDANHLENWWSPTGFKSIHASMDFRVGGVYLYGNEGPDGMQIWGKQVFREIVINERLTCIQSFSDKNGGVTRHPMSATWPLEMLATTTFEDVNGSNTKVTLTWQPWNSDDIGNSTFEAARSGMEQGVGGSFTKLEAYLKTL
ncbi:MAG: SRPBCC family protein [Polaromonas sp.]